jgi:hypothetical protein
VGPATGHPRSESASAGPSLHNRNPKSEFRNPKQIQNTNEKYPNRSASGVLVIGLFDFRFVSDFDIRISDFWR